MITGKDIYDVLAAIVPLYVAMILAYGSVRWWKIFTPEQCSGINRFVAVFAVPLLSFHFISTNNIYAMNFHFIAADSLQKVIILIALLVWQSISKRGSLEWMITLFSLSTLPNTLVMGIPLLRAMYGDFSGDLMVQIVVLQSVIWYTLMLFLFEYRGARILINEQFPDTAACITSFKVDSDVVSLNGRDPLQADAEIAPDGKLHVTLRRSSTSSMISSFKSHGLNSITSITPRASNLTGVEIYSVQSSREPTPRASSFNQSDFYAMFAGKAVGASPPKHRYTNSFSHGGLPEIYSLQSSKMATPRTSNFDEEMMRTVKRIGGRSMSGELNNAGSGAGFLPAYPPPNPMFSGSTSSNPSKKDSQKNGSKELHMFVWSSSTSPVSEGNFGRAVNKAVSTESDAADLNPIPGNPHKDNSISKGVQDVTNSTSPGKKKTTMGEGEDGKYVKEGEIEEGCKFPTNGSPYTYRKKVEGDGYGGSGRERKQQMPPTSVMIRLILIMVWRKLIRNPNTYSSLLGLTWSLVSFRWQIEMPSIVKGSISILSDAGLGMAMFSLGLFMALQPKIIACGKTVAMFSLAVRFLTGPAVIAATSIAIGLRGVLLHVAIVQAALPQGIVPFVFAKEYNVHPDILSTAVIFGMLIALPITILYYVLLGI